MEEIVWEIQKIMDRLRISVTQKDMKEFAYHLSLFSGIVWDLFRAKEAAELKHKIEEEKEIQKLVKWWLSHNKAKNDAQVKMMKYEIKEKEALSEYKKSVLLKESYVNYMWICKQELTDWWAVDMMANVFSNISDD